MGITSPTITGLETKTEPKATAVTTTWGPTTTYTGSTTKGTKKEVKGKLEFKVATKKECDDMAAQNGKDAIIKMLATETGLDKTNIALAVTCTAARRLSDGRKLTAYNAKVEYTMTVPATSTVAASTVTTKLKSFDATTWTTKLKDALAAAATPVTVTITGLTATAPTTTTIHDVSSAITFMLSPLAGLFFLTHFLL